MSNADPQDYLNQFNDNAQKMLQPWAKLNQAFLRNAEMMTDFSLNTIKTYSEMSLDNLREVAKVDSPESAKEFSSKQAEIRTSTGSTRSGARRPGRPSRSSSGGRTPRGCPVRTRTRSATDVGKSLPVVRACHRRRTMRGRGIRNCCFAPWLSVLPPSVPLALVGSRRVPPQTARAAAGSSTAVSVAALRAAGSLSSTRQHSASASRTASMPRTGPWVASCSHSRRATSPRVCFAWWETTDRVPSSRSCSTRTLTVRAAGAFHAAA